jgi:peptidoglycan/LPS O-acetylase OafA/YrhL
MLLPSIAQLSIDRRMNGVSAPTTNAARLSNVVRFALGGRSSSLVLPLVPTIRSRSAGAAATTKSARPTAINLAKVVILVFIAQPVECWKEALMSATSLGRVPQLDGIRAIAVTTVILAHCGLDKIVPGGFGVTIFFFLSGYLITSLLRGEYQATANISLRNFYIRRSFRIIPPLWITLMFVWLLVSAGLIHRDIDPLAALSQFWFVQNYSELWHHGSGVLPITGVWSLAVEEHFYLLFPLLYWAFLARVTAARAVMVCAAVCVAVLAIRYVNTLVLSDYSENYSWSHTRIDSILFGSCLALRHNPRMDSDARRTPGWQAVVALAAIAASLVVRNGVFRETLRYTIQSGALYVLFSYALSNDGWLGAILSCRPAKVVALYSYTLYLVHIPLMLVADRYLPFPHPVRMLIAVAAAFGYAMLMHMAVERPMADIRKRLERRSAESSVDGLAAAT